MKALVFGLGNIGVRHVRNLKALRPDCLIVGADPRLAGPLQSAISNGYYDSLPVTYLYEDWRKALERHPDADAAIIASPTQFHMEQMEAFAARSIPFYVEKPLIALEQMNPMMIDLLDDCADLHCAVDFQYRFHPILREAARKIIMNEYARFYACDDLLAKYGPDCLSYIAAHPIDTALWLFGPANSIRLKTDGLTVYGTIEHAHGESFHDYRIDAKIRISTVTTEKNGGRDSESWSLYANDDMYRDALAAWLAWATGGAARDDRTATLDDGLCVMEVMAQTKIKEGERQP